jgi:hypothetical protein
MIAVIFNHFEELATNMTSKISGHIPSYLHIKKIEISREQTIKTRN